MPPGGFLVGVCRPLLQILPLFQTKTLLYPTPFFRPGVGRNYVTITWIERQQKRVLKIHLEFAYYSFFGIETTNAFMHSLENHTYPNSDPDGQSPYLFSDPENGAKTLPFGGAHTHKVNIREYPPGTYPAYGLIDTQKNVPSGRWDGYTTGSGGIICDLDCSFKILQLIQHARFAFVYCTVAEHWIIFF